ncbi:MAG: type I methionyl aminopeptidase [Actinomycetota bacterium]|nr:type I methionyl aminopeptidase [Actinomycetota bacterium]
MVELRTPGEIEAMRASGRVVAQALQEVRAAATVGSRLSTLDDVAGEVILGAGATSPFLGYQPSFAPTPFRGVICTSVNDVALHGTPGPYRLADGDLLSIDCGSILDGWAADAATSFVVGIPRQADLELIETTKAALDAGIRAARVGGRLGDISAAIAAVGRAARCGISTDYGGHGIGRTMHQDPSVPNDGRPGRGLPLRSGLVIAIEPWFMAGGGDGYLVDDDGWTLRSADGSRAAHVEHTVALTPDGPLILTAPPESESGRP